MLLFHTSKGFTIYGYIPLFFLFIALYPFLVFIAQRPIFQFSVTELIGWIITHIFFHVINGVSHT